MDSMEFLMNFPLLKDAKRGHKKRHSFKGKTIMKLLGGVGGGREGKELSEAFSQLKPSCVPFFLFSFYFFFIFKGLHSVKTVPLNQGRSKVKPAVSEVEKVSTSGGRKPLRRSLGLDSFPGVLLFRTCFAGKHNTKKNVLQLTGIH